MSTLKNLPCNSWRKLCCYAALYTQERSKACTLLHAYNYCLIHLPDSQKHWSPELQRKWLESKQTCQPELVLSSVRLIRQSFIFCPYNQRVISVCWLHYISAWFAWKAPLCFLAVGVMLLLRSSAQLYSSRHGKITLCVWLKPYCFKTVDCNPLKLGYLRMHCSSIYVHLYVVYFSTTRMLYWPISIQELSVL